MEIHLCQNCGNGYTEQYCNRCGQKTVHRISLGHIAHEVVHAFTHADKGIIHLFVRLLMKPGIVAREYIIEGKRKKYFSPVQYLLIIASLATFVVLTTHLMDHMMTESPFMSGSAMSPKKLAFMKRFTDFFSKYFNIVLLLQLPMFALASYVVYRKYKMFYAEHLTLHIFITAQVTIYSVIMMLVFLNTKPSLFYIFPSLVNLVYTVVAYRQFFGERSFRGTIKAIFSFILGHLIYFIFFLTIILGIVLLMDKLKLIH